MSENLWDFFGKHPFWAVIILIFAILPIVGAVLHILLKAFGRHGIDRTPPEFEYGPPENSAPDNDNNEKMRKSG